MTSDKPSIILLLMHVVSRSRVDFDAMHNDQKGAQANSSLCIVVWLSESAYFLDFGFSDARNLIKSERALAVHIEFMYMTRLDMF